MTNTDEMQYINLIKECIEHGSEKSDRTGTGTLSLVGRSMRYNLNDHILPLLTTKFVPFRVVLEELLFFIRGQTDNKILRSKNIGIWNGNSSKEFFAKHNIEREEDDLGPIYGFQWRHFGAEYKTCKDEYSHQGIDQLQNAIDTLRNNPNSRRMVVCAWNPIQLNQVALPPCHTIFQLVADKGKLSCILYQRSADLGLGVPFNIASYSILTHMIAHITGHQAHEFIHFIGDCHIYLDHIDPLKTQLSRIPTDFPKLRFSDRNIKEIDDFVFEDFILDGYNPQEKIVMKMSV